MTQKLVKDRGTLWTFYGYPTHWTHLRTVSLIAWQFATVRLRGKVTKGPKVESNGIQVGGAPTNQGYPLDKWLGPWNGDAP